MNNNFLDKNERIKEAICTFRAEPNGDTYKAIFQQVCSMIPLRIRKPLIWTLKMNLAWMWRHW